MGYKLFYKPKVLLFLHTSLYFVLSAYLFDSQFVCQFYGSRKISVIILRPYFVYSFNGFMMTCSGNDSLVLFSARSKYENTLHRYLVLILTKSQNCMPNLSGSCLELVNSTSAKSASLSEDDIWFVMTRDNIRRRRCFYFNVFTQIWPVQQQCTIGRWYINSIVTFFSTPFSFWIR